MNTRVIRRWGFFQTSRPAADLPEMAIRAKATVIHVNLEDVSLGGDREIMLRGSAAQVLPELLGRLGVK